MDMLTQFVILVCARTILCGVNAQNVRKFSEDFRFGVSTAAYQIEGGWDEDGKGISQWDHLVHTDPSHITDVTNGDVAADSYHLYHRDVEMLKELNVDSYRFSISWPRILPNGRPDYVNPNGVAHYNDLINLLLVNDIEPFVTLYHWDLPQALAEQGGLLNDSFPKWFGDYARVVYQSFGDRVKYWMTLNEPYIHCYISFRTGVHPPRIKAPGTDFYKCGRNFLLAHAKAYHIYYNEGLGASRGGKVGIIINSEWAIPSTDSENDIKAVADWMTFQFDQYMDPIFSAQGNYPKKVIDRIAAVSAEQGFNSSRLQPFSDEEAKYIKGTSDFLALNHYSTDVVYRNASIVGMNPIPSLFHDAFVAMYKDSSWPTSSSSWLSEYAPGFYSLMIYIKEKYNNPVIYITENGFSTLTGLNDDDRVRYIRNYLTAVHQALTDGVNVKGYFAWSLMDNFEWAEGFAQRFGLYEVNMDDPNRTRTPRKSALVYSEIVRTKSIDLAFNPDPYAAPGSSNQLVSAVTLVMVCLYHLAR